MLGKVEQSQDVSFFIELTITLSGDFPTVEEPVKLADRLKTKTSQDQKWNTGQHGQHKADDTNHSTDRTHHTERMIFEFINGFR